MAPDPDENFDRQYSLEELVDCSELVVPEKPAAIGVGAEGDPRLMIKEIVNENFKSYAGTKVIGPFHKAFTSIIGPNGSGKSNVIDSMLFVFGYRAQKIRSKKVSVLIHNSTKHPNLQKAIVSVKFHMIVDREGDAYDVVPGTEFTVSRTAFKDNSSCYHIDGRKTNFKEVGKFLRTKGIDLDHNRFLILQGEVEQISQMKPKAENKNEEGMLEYLEDIIGSSRLKPLIDKLGHQVEQLNDHRNQREGRLKIAETEMNKLKPEYEAGVAWIQRKNDMTRDIHKIRQATIYQCNVKTKRDQGGLQNLEEELTLLEDDIKNYKVLNKDILVEQKKCKKKHTKIRDAMHKLTDKIAESEGTAKGLKEEQKNIKKRQAALEKELEKEEKNVKKFQEMPVKCEQETEELNEKLEQLVIDEKNQNNDYETAIQEVGAKTKDLRKQKAPLEKKLLEVQNSVNEKKQILDQEKAVLDEYTAKYDREKNKLHEMHDSIKAAEKTVADNAEKKNQLENSIPEMEEALRERQIEVEKMKNERPNIQTKIEQLSSKLADAQQEEGGGRSRGKVLDYVMNLKSKKIVPGVVGRLGDLGGIDQRYDVALSSSCDMDYIVVERAADATKILEYVKRDKVGAVRFFALDKVRPFAPADQFNLPGPRLVDQIRCDREDLMGCFFQACGNTLVARNSEEAERFAFNSGGRHRAVSLDGVLVESSGAMTGGGGRKQSGAMGEKPQINVRKETVSEDEINEMNTALNDFRQELRDLDSQIREANGFIARTTKEIAKNKSDLQQLNASYDTALKKIDMVKKSIKDQEKRLKDATPDKKRLHELEDAMKDAECEWGATKASAQSVQEEVDEINKQITAMGKGKVEGIKKLMQKTKDAIKDSKKKLLKLANDLKTASRKQQTAEENLQTLKDEKEEKAKRLTQIAEEMDKLAAEYAEMKDDLVDIENDHLSAAVEAEKEIDAKVAESEKAIETKLNDIKKFQAQRNDLQSKLVHYETKIAEAMESLKNLSLTSTGENDEDLTFPIIPDEDLADMDTNAVSQQAAKTKAALDESRPNLSAMKEYRDKNEVYTSRRDEFNEINDVRNRKREMRNDLMKMRRDEFTKGFEIITAKVKQMYQMITMGGDAELELVNTLAPFEEGVVFTVRPPKKSWKTIMNLSGGEKTLSSLSLVFALHHYKPTPLYVMDEIDAALDIKNVSIVANYIKDRTKNAQFVIISLRNQMFGLCSRLIGIYKTHDCTKLVLMENDPDEVAKRAEEHGERERTPFTGVANVSAS